MPGFHRSVAVPLSRCRSVATVVVAGENGNVGNVFPYSIHREEVTRTLIGCQPTAEWQKLNSILLLRIGCYGTTAGGTATAQWNFSHKHRNSYGIYTSGTAKPQRNGGNQALGTWPQK